MKHLSLSIILVILSFEYVAAQVPQAFSYQAIARDKDGELITDQNISVKIGIRDGSATGFIIYEETHSTSTNEIGLFSIKIGNGTVTSGSFTIIDWGASVKYLDISLDASGGSSYTNVGTIQLLSVPYALFAGKTTETDPDYNSSVAKGITETDTAIWNNKLDTEVDGSVNNELQTISRTGLTVTLSNDGGSFADSVNVFSGDMNSGNITNLADPINGQDAVTKAYVDLIKQELLELINSNNAGGTVTDFDGNIYNTVKIGNQWWIAENLKVTKYPDGSAIPLVTDNTAWANLGDNDTDDAYCYYNNNANGEADTYGALYTYAAALNACPTGWHLPTDAEWTELENYLIANGYNWDGTTTGNKIGKSLAATSGWNTSPTVGNVGNDQASNNATGFTALPGGHRRHASGLFDYAGVSSYWWSSTESSSALAYFPYLSTERAILSSLYNGTKSTGLSVRCIKD